MFIALLQVFEGSEGVRPWSDEGTNTCRCVPTQVKSHSSFAVGFLFQSHSPCMISLLQFLAFPTYQALVRSASVIFVQ